MQDIFPVKPEKNVSGNPCDKGSLHILVVEDDPVHMELALRTFRTTLEQFRISYARTLREARKIIAGDPPDLIITDWMLPDGDGIEILPIRDGHVATPLIVMTSHGDEKLAVEIMKSGAIDYLVKSRDIFHNLPHIARRALREWENIRKRTLAEEALHQREATLETLLNAPDDTIALLDRQGIIIRINENGAKRLGGTAREITGRCAYDLLPAGIVPSRKEHIDQVFETGVPAKFDDIRAGLTIHNEIYPVFNPDHTAVEHIAIFATDITERKNAEEALHETETRFRELFNNMSSGVAIYDVVGDGEDFIFRDINHSAETIDHVRKDDVVGHSVLEIFPGVKEFGLFEVFQRVAKTGIAEAHPVARYKDNRIAGWRENFVYKLPSGEIVAIYEDVTEKRQAEEALRQSEERYRALLFGAGIWVGYWNMDGTLLYLNDIGIKRLKGREEDFIGKNMHELFGDADAEKYLERINKAAVSSEPREYEDFVRLPSGDGWYLSVYTRITGPDGTVKGVQVMSMDITDRKQGEEDLKNQYLLLSTLLDSQKNPIFSLDLKYRYTSFNKTHASVIKALYGTDIEIGKNILECQTVTADRETTKKNLDRALNGESFVECAYSGEKDRFRRYFEVYHNPIKTMDGIITGVVVFALDITERRLAEEALRIAQEKYSKAFLSAPDAITISELESGRFIEVNEAAIKIFGYSRDELIGKSALELNIWLEQTDRESFISRIRAHGRILQHEVVERRKSGELFYASVTAETITINNSKCIIAILRDVTAQKQVEQALRESRLMLEEAMDLAHMANWEFDALTGIFTFNDRFYTLYGTTAEREGGYQMPADKYAHEFVHRDDQYVVADEVNKAIHATDPGYVSNLEHRIIRRDGEVRHIVVRFGITKDANGRTIKTHGANQDITERKKAEEALRENEERYRKVVEQSHDGIYIYRGSKFLFVNDRVVEITGYSKEELYEMAFVDLLHPDDRAFVMEIAQKRARGEEASRTYETRIITKDKKVRFLELAVTPLVYQGGYAALGSARDITEQKAVEEVIRKSEERFRALIQNSSDMIRILDRDRKIVYESPSTERLLGYPAGFFIRKDPWDYIHPDDIERVKTDLQEVYDKKNPGIPIEFRIRKADGSYVWVDTIGVNLLGVPGVDGIVVTTRPIDERKKLEQEILKSEERLRLALEGADVASWDRNLVTGKAVFSDKFYTMLGYEPGEFPADYEDWVSLIHPDDKKKVIPDLEAQIRNHQPLCEIEYRMKDKDGDWHWILGRGKIAESDEQGKAVRLTGVNIDITGRKLMESEIRSLNTVLEQRVIQRTEQLNTALKEKELLLREIHHRVKNNLQIISSLLNLQSRYIKDEHVLSAIKESQNRVKAMALVHERLYRSENISRISIGEYVTFLTDNLIHFYGVNTHNIKIIVDIKDLNFDINTAIPLGLIFNELVSNSLKHAFPGNRKGEIRITGVSGATRSTFVIHDNGIGLPSGLDWKNTETLGLRLVISLIDQLEGTIELSEMEGTTFTIKIMDAAGGAP